MAAAVSGERAPSSVSFGNRVADAGERTSTARFLPGTGSSRNSSRSVPRFAPLVGEQSAGGGRQSGRRFERSRPCQCVHHTEDLHPRNTEVTTRDQRSDGRAHDEWKQNGNKWRERGRSRARRTERKLLFWRRDRDGTRHIHVPRPAGGLRPCKTASCSFVEPWNFQGSQILSFTKTKKPRKGAFVFWRRDRDSNPGTPVRMLLEFQSSAFDRSAISPNKARRLPSRPLVRNRIRRSRCRPTAGPQAPGRGTGATVAPAAGGCRRGSGPCVRRPI